MKQEQCFQLGFFSRKVGTDGRLSLQMDTDQPESYTKTESVFVELHGKLVPFFVVSFRMQPSQTAHVKLEDVDDSEAADSLTGCPVFLPLDLLPKLSGNKFYYHEVIGWTIQDLTSGLSAGTIRDVLENGPNDLFQLTNEGQEVLIPVADDWITKVDRENSVIEMTLPEGLLDVNRK